jgi:choline kinase
LKLKNAIILAAGLGNRLNSISGSKPKCLVEIEGKPILFYTLTKLIRKGYGKICIVTGYNSSQIENYIKRLYNL